MRAFLWGVTVLGIAIVGACSDCACSDATPDATDASPDAAEAWVAPPPTLWPEGPAFEVKGALAEALSQGPGLSLDALLLPWVSHATGADRPDVGHLAGFGVGNGHVFALLGYPETGPLNTLHGLVGPTYERGERFFGDYAVELLGDDGKPRAFDEAWVARGAGPLAVVSRERYGQIEVDVVTAAPYVPLTGSTEAHPGCLLRLVAVRNTGDTATAALSLQVRGKNPDVQASGDHLTEASTERALTTAWSADATAAARALVTPVGPLAPGAEVRVALTHCTAEGTTPPPAWRPSDDEALEVARGALQDGLAAGGTYPSLDLPDPRVAAFLDGMRGTIGAQTAATGAVCPMSQYTRTWARDNIGPALYQLVSGDHEALARAMDYVWGATLAKGDLQNSYDADLDLEATTPEPDWPSLGPLGVRVGAETPSYLVILYGLWYRHTGDLEKARERWGLLRRAMLDVRFDVDRLLPWTGDETFRAAMNEAFGLGLDVAHHELSFSLNSNILWLAAARHFVLLGQALGKDADVAAVQALAAEMEQKAMPRYLLADGCYSALIDRATGETWPAPFEDASLTPTWAGWLDGDDPRAAANLQCLQERLGTSPGVVQSPPDPKYVNFPLFPSQQGVFTGMKPGYTLAALTDVGHPDAEAAFNELARTLDAGGNVDEYHLFSSAADLPYPGLTIFYNEQGLEPSDYTAKFRPWEGGIVAAAAWQYLLGWSPDVPARHLSLRPHLPNGWSHARYGNLRGGDARFTVELTRLDPTHVRLDVAVDSGPSPFDTVTLRWDAAGPVAAVDGSGAAVPPVRTVERFGRTSTLVEGGLGASGLSWVLSE